MKLFIELERIYVSFLAVVICYLVHSRLYAFILKRRLSSACYSNPHVCILNVVVSFVLWIFLSFFYTWVHLPRESFPEEGSEVHNNRRGVARKRWSICLLFIMWYLFCVIMDISFHKFAHCRCLDLIYSRLHLSYP